MWKLLTNPDGQWTPSITFGTTFYNTLEDKSLSDYKDTHRLDNYN